MSETVPNCDPRSGDGSSMIAYELITRLPENVEVELLAFEAGLPVPDEIRARCARVQLLQRRSRTTALLRSVVSAWEVGACERSGPAATRQVRERSAEADVTMLHGPHVAFLAQHVVGPAALQVVDPWSARLRMEAAMSGSLRRLFLQFRALRMEQAEHSLPAELTLLTVGPQDARDWERLLGRSVTAIPNGVTTCPRATATLPSVPTVCFAGSLGYAPNIDSAQRLVRQVAPLVWAERPDARFVLVGRSPAPEVLALAGERVDVRADVPSVPDELARAHVAVFPDRFGVGVRNTVREALASGACVVATSVAARSLEEMPGLVVADGDAELAAATLAAFATPRPSPTSPQGDGDSWGTMARSYLDVLESTRSLQRR